MKQTKVNEEKELLTILTEEEYNRCVSFFTKKFGKPTLKKRLALQSDDYDQEDVDTRIKITDGKAELIQKIGKWQNITTGEARMETTINLPNDAKTIFDLYRVLRNLNKGTNVQNIIMQFENLLWKTKDFEIKLGKQFGGDVAYNCEIEVFKQNLGPLEIAGIYNIPINPPPNSLNFWHKWNKRVNLLADEISDNKLMGIITKYIKKR